MASNKKITRESNLFGKSSNKVIAYTDGGARGNPGPAALGVVIKYSGSKKEYGEYIGETTNNVAEYSAIVFALKKIKQLFGKGEAKKLEVEIRADSELAVRQLSGVYKIENGELQKLFMEIWNLKLDFKHVMFTHVPRAQNVGADQMVNLALDNQ